MAQTLIATAPAPQRCTSCPARPGSTKSTRGPGLPRNRRNGSTASSPGTGKSARGATRPHRPKLLAGISPPARPRRKTHSDYAAVPGRCFHRLCQTKRDPQELAGPECPLRGVGQERDARSEPQGMGCGRRLGRMAGGGRTGVDNLTASCPGGDRPRLSSADVSQVRLDTAASRAREIDHDISFVRADVVDPRDLGDESFDVVYKDVMSPSGFPTSTATTRCMPESATWRCADVQRVPPVPEDQAAFARAA